MNLLKMTCFASPTNICYWFVSSHLAMRAESKAYIQEPEGHHQQDFESTCRTNEAIKASLDHLNGGRVEVLNGNGSVNSTSLVLPPAPPPPVDQTKIDAIAHHHHQPHLHHHHHHHHNQAPQPPQLHHQTPPKHTQKPQQLHNLSIPPFHLQEKKNTDV